MLTIKHTVSTMIQARINAMLPENAGVTAPAVEDISMMLEYPPNPEMGDLAFPCFKLSKILRRSPLQSRSYARGSGSSPA